MKNTKLVVIVLVIIVAIGGFLVLTKNKGGSPTTVGTDKTTTTSSGSKTFTAKQAYPIAFAEAKKFASDVYLVNLSTSGTQSNGESNSWFATFYSPSKDVGYRVGVVDGKINNPREEKKNNTDKVTDGWIDSTQAAKVGIPKCGTVIDTDYFFDLDVSKAKTEWSISCLVGEDKTLKILIDAYSGDFLRTSQAGIGW